MEDKFKKQFEQDLQDNENNQEALESIKTEAENFGYEDVAEKAEQMITALKETSQSLETSAHASDETITELGGNPDDIAEDLKEVQEEAEEVIEKAETSINRSAYQVGETQNISEKPTHEGGNYVENQSEIRSTNEILSSINNAANELLEKEDNTVTDRDLNISPIEAENILMNNPEVFDELGMKLLDKGLLVKAYTTFQYSKNTEMLSKVTEMMKEDINSKDVLFNEGNDTGFSADRYKVAKVTESYASEKNKGELLSLYKKVCDSLYDTIKDGGREDGKNASIAESNISNTLEKLSLEKDMKFTPEDFNEVFNSIDMITKEDRSYGLSLKEELQNIIENQ